MRRIPSFASAVVSALDSRMEKAASTFATFFKSVRPTLKADASGRMSFSFDLSESASSSTVEQVFEYLAKESDCEIVIALDEFRAVAKVGCVAEPTSAEFMSSGGLSAPSTVAGAIKQLISNELLYRTDAGYVVYDRLFGEYLRGVS